MAFTVRPVTPLDAEAVLPLAVAKMQARVDGDDEDALLGSLWAAALRWVETYTGRSLQRRVWEARFDGWGGVRRLPVEPVAAIDQVEYRGTTGAAVMLASSAYRLAGMGVEPAYGSTWPVADIAAGSVTVRFAAGYEDVASEEPPLIAAALLTFAHLSRNREAVTSGPAVEVPFSAKALCEAYRTPVIG